MYLWPFRDVSWLRIYWLAMARRFWIGFYGFALVALAAQILLAIFALCLGKLQWREVLPVSLAVLALSWITWVDWRLLKRELARCE